MTIEGVENACKYETKNIDQKITTLYLKDVYPSIKLFSKMHEICILLIAKLKNFCALLDVVVVVMMVVFMFVVWVVVWVVVVVRFVVGIAFGFVVGVQSATGMTTE